LAGLAAVGLVVGFAKLAQDLAACRSADDVKPPWERDVPV
jgi:hypothetical protein